VALIISKTILAKIGQPDHGSVTKKEVEQCFANHSGRYAYDRRTQHLDRKGKPTPWFVSQTNQGRRLKIMFVRVGEDIKLRSAYPATSTVAQIFEVPPEDKVPDMATTTTNATELSREPWEAFDDDLEGNVSVVPEGEETEIENALELQMISIRLQKELISNLKLIADHHNIGYQPLIRDLLNRFVKFELKDILATTIRQKEAQLEALKDEDEDQGLEAVEQFLTRRRA